MMSMAARGWALLGCAIAAEVTATLSLKGALEAPALYAVVVFGYLGAFVLLTAVLRTGIGLGVAYGIWAAAGVAFTAVLSMAVYGEPLTPLIGVGIALVITGVLCVELGSRTGPTGAQDHGTGAEAPAAPVGRAPDTGPAEQADR